MYVDVHLYCGNRHARFCISAEAFPYTLHTHAQLHSQTEYKQICQGTIHVSQLKNCGPRPSSSTSGNTCTINISNVNKLSPPNLYESVKSINYQ